MSQSTPDDVVLLAVGDVGPCRSAPDSIFEYVREDIGASDIAFCQLEVNLSDRGSRLPQVRHTTRSSPDTARAMRECGFNVVSVAGNHCMDWGRDAFDDTLDALKTTGIAAVGAGANRAEARKPVIVDCKGTKVAFLAYCSILPEGFWADENRAGCSPLRAWTIYEQIEKDQPGTPPRIHTFADRGDLQALTEDIRLARAQADIVVLSMHWGIHFVPYTIADYQREVAHAAIDAGADVILGHHAHILKGVEIYRGKPVFYSLCNFALDVPLSPAMMKSKAFLEIQSLNPDWQPDTTCTYTFPPDSQMTIVVRFVLRDGKVHETTLLPTFINLHSQPRLMKHNDPEFSEVVSYLAKASAEAGFDTQFLVDGSQVRMEVRHAMAGGEKRQEQAIG
ncbi:CapA family protein [Paraburkholderia fungorum]|uniref:CapA family protein n=1 Tax=Paraburkholderia fungorum TaxID=134537 RepID=UPI00209389D7|nr:CapA family protein [Paraburkholderia fungorum]USU18907.1 CapA family protein [Paraburkholderia fungorum]USU29097.1 CapA family protein [Paraburkholderia fungorum]